jgi:hypothetical protein
MKQASSYLNWMFPAIRFIIKNKRSYILKMKLIQILLLILSSLIIISCDNTETREFQRRFEEKLQSALDDISKSSAPPLEEVKKLSQVEYHMEVFPLETSADEVGAKLNVLGNDRWDCFASFARPRTEPDVPEMVVLCKRMPETVLRYLPRSFTGR